MSKQNQKQKSKFIRVRDIWNKIHELNEELEILYEKFDEILTKSEVSKDKSTQENLERPRDF